MKKVFLSLMIMLLICSACGKKVAEIVAPDVIEQNIEEINRLKKETAKESINNIIRTAQLYYIEQQLNANYVPKDIVINFGSSVPSDFVFSGIMPTSGTLTIDENGNIFIKDIVINDYKCSKNDENKIICE